MAAWRGDMATQAGLTFDRMMQAIIISGEQLYDWVPEDGVQSLSDHITALNNSICERLRHLASVASVPQHVPLPVPSGGSDGRASSDDLVRLYHRGRISWTASPAGS